MNRPWFGDRGSGGALGLAFAAALVLAASAIIAGSAFLAARARAATAADAAALAAADAASGALPGVPCELADRLAAAHGAALVTCELDGLVATVEVVAASTMGAAAARATAGPPP